MAILIFYGADGVTPMIFYTGLEIALAMATRAILRFVHFPRFFTSSSIRFFQSALSGLQARTLHTASLMTS